MNERIVEFMNDRRDIVYQDEATLKKEIIDKLNSIGQTSSDLLDEKYELRFQRDKGPKYIQLRCVMQKCKFNAWFSFEGSAT